MSRDDEGRGDGSDAFAAPGQPESIRRRRRQRYRHSGSVTQCSDSLGSPRPKMWPVADHLDGDIADLETSLPYPDGSFPQQHDAGRPRPLRFGHPEMFAEIADTCRGKQRVGGSMGGDIAVRVTGQAALTGPTQTRQPEFSLVVLRSECVHVDADAGSR
jgi:hypothetical protein